jgi:hypothetical protein
MGFVLPSIRGLCSPAPDRPSTGERGDVSSARPVGGAPDRTVAKVDVVGVGQPSGILSPGGRSGGPGRWRAGLGTVPRPPVASPGREDRGRELEEVELVVVVAGGRPSV